MDGFENIRRTVLLEEPGESDTLKMSVDNSPNFTDNEDGDEVVKLKTNAKTKKGRGFKLEGDGGNSDFENFEVIVSGEGDKGKSLDDKLAQRSRDGWIVFVSGIHEEAHEEDVLGPFSEFGEIKTLHLNLDRRTGFLKGYALIEFGSYAEAEAAKNAMNGAEILGSRISVDWAFMQKSANRSRRVVK